MVYLSQNCPAFLTDLTATYIFTDDVLLALKERGDKFTATPVFTTTWLKADVNFPVCWHTCAFSFFFLLGYEPMKGDWVQAKYSISPTQWTTQAQSVAPLRYCRLDQVTA